MGKMNKEEQARREGMSYALRVAKEKGIDGLEEELKFRNISEFPIALPRKAIDECIGNVKAMTVDTIRILVVSTLHDEFYFGAKRCQRFMDRFDYKAECLMEDYCTWQDIINQIQEELGLQLSIRQNDKDVKV